MDQAPKYLQNDELARLWKVIKKPRDLAMFKVAFWRGLRASEIGLLELADVRMAAGRIYVHRLKHSRSGEYLMSDEEIRALRAWLRVRGEEPGPLFPSRNHRPIDRTTLHRLMQRYGALAMIPKAKRHFHVLKHSIGTWLMGQPEAEIRKVQDWLGHVNIQNTCVYAQVTNPERDRFSRRIYGRR